MKRYLHFMVAGALALAGLPDSAAAQLTTGITVDTNAVGNALAIPFVTHGVAPVANQADVVDPAVLLGRQSNLGYVATVINISNTKDIVFGQAGPVYLHFEVISGDVAGGTIAAAGFLNPLDVAAAGNRTNTTISDFWVSQDVVCITTPGETTQITIEPYDQPGVPPTSEQSMWMFECSDPDEAPGLTGDHGDRFNQNGSKSFGGTQARIFDAKNGVLWVTQETLPHSGIYKEGDILEGRAHVMEMDLGGAYILDAIPFNGLANFDGADGEWRFDGHEYPNAPLNWMSSVILPDGDGTDATKNVRAEFLLFSLDGNLSAKKGPRPKFEYMWYDDDENRQQSDTYWFECFAWIDLDEDLNINARTAGTPTGHVRLKHLAQTSITDTVHDADHDAGVSDGKRVYPFYGYLVQRYDLGSEIQKSCVHPDNAGLGSTQAGQVAPEGNVCGILDVIGNPANEVFDGYAVTAHLLTKGSNAMIPSSGDRPAMTRN